MGMVVMPLQVRNRAPNLLHWDLVMAPNCGEHMDLDKVQE